jgi:O-antigen/teichoic acid export membrane protein
LPEEGQPPPHRDLWSKLLPFAAWIWTASLLGNLFEIADRYMIVHFSPAGPAAALAQVGQYHSSRVVPLLMVSIAVMLGSIITPHLSHDWEQGRRDRVAARLNLLIKLLSFSLCVAAVAVLFASPLLFDVAFQGKFSAGLAVLPWTLTYCIWFGMLAVAQNYLWCAEKARLASVALLIGLVTNVALNLLLLPRLGLLGAVLATTAANLVALLLIAAFNHLLGFHMDRGARIALALPPVLCLGPWVALIVLIAVAAHAAKHDWLLSGEQKRQLAQGCLEYWQRFRSFQMRLTRQRTPRVSASNHPRHLG